MGLFKAARDFTEQGRENLAESLAEVNTAPLSPELIAEATRTIPTEDAVAADASVVHFGGSIGAIDVDPVLQLDLLVLAPEALPRPRTIRARVPLGQTPHLHEGATIPVVVSRSEPTHVAIDWTRL